MAKRGYKLQEFVAHSGNVNCLSFGKKNCRVFITGGDDQKVNLWSIGKPTSVVSLCGHTSPVESAAFDSAEVLVVAGSSSGAIKLWDLEETKMVRTLTGHRSYCTAVEFHPFGEFFASGSMDTNLKIWDIKKKGCIHTYKGHTRGISTIRFTPDGRWVVSGGFDNVVKIWDLTAGKLLHDFKFHEGHIRSIEFHPLEFLLATGSADKTVKFWDLETFEMIGSARRESSGVRAIAFHPDGRNLFCGLDDALKVYSWEPVICHDSVDMGWSTLGDLCIHDGKLLGGAYYENSVAVWVADISLIEPYGTKSATEQYTYSEQKSETEGSEGSLFEKAKEESQVKLKPNVPFDNQDSDSKEIKTIYVDRVNSVTPKAVEPVNAPKVVLSSVALKAVEPVNAPKVVQNSVTPKAIESVSTPKVVLNSSTPKAVEPVNAPKVVRLSESKEVGTAATQKRVPAKANAVKSRSVIIPSIVPRDSSDGKDFSGSRRESIGSAKANIGIPSRQSTVRRLSTGRFGMERMSVSLDAGTAENIKSPLGIKKETDLCDRVRTDENAKESSEGKLPIINAPGIAEESVEGKQSSTKAVAENLDTTSSLTTESSDQTSNSSDGANPVKVINGVTVVHGRTRSLVEKFEKQEKFNAEVMKPDRGATAEPPETPLIENFDRGSSAIAEPLETPTSEEFDKESSATAKPLETYPIRKNDRGSCATTEPLETYPMRKPDRGCGVTAEPLETYPIRNPDRGSGATAEPFESSPVRKPDKGFGETTESLDTLPKQRRGSAVRVEPLEIPPIGKPKRGFGTAPEPPETSLIQKSDRRSRAGADRRSVTPEPFEAPIIQKSDRSRLSAEPLESPQVQKSGRGSCASDEPLEMPVLQNCDRKTTAREEPFMDDTYTIENLMQTHDVLLSTFRSRLTKLQVIRHFWERNDVKGAINAVKKLPDHSVQADVVGILIERLDKITLDLFSCLLPVLLGLLDSKAERYVTISLEMLLKLVAVFGTTIRTTALAPPGVGVDLHAEERRECCKRCFAYLEDIQRKLPELVKKGGSITRYAQQLNLVLQQT